MNIYYAHGGGWGHISRIRRFIDQQENEPFKVLTANPVAYRYFREEEVLFIEEHLSKNTSEYSRQLQDLFDHFAPEVIYIDTFPCGILGEFKEFSFPEHSSIHLLARRVKWEAYSQKTDGTDIRFDKVYVLEELEEEEMEFLQAHSTKLEKYPLEYPIPKNIPKEVQRFSNGYWVIVHSGPPHEIRKLCEWAMNKLVEESSIVDVVLITSEPFYFEGMHNFTDQTAAHWYEGAEKIFTGAGFNCFYETEPYRDKQHILPFPRKYDDQQWRMNTLNKS